jgi:phosphoglycolate phosphatase
MHKEADRNVPRTENVRQMPRQFKLILWDFDGTLANTLGSALRSYNRLAVKHGYLPITDTDAVRDMTTRQFLKAHGIPIHKVPGLFGGFLTEQRKGPPAPLFDGIADTIRQSAAAGMRHGVVSSNSTQTIDRSLATADLSDCFDCVVATSRLFGKAKGLQKAARDQGLPPEQILYVGDEVRDIEAARTAGMPVASVTWGLNSESLLQQRQPDWILNQPADLLQALGSTTEPQT